MRPPKLPGDIPRLVPDEAVPCLCLLSPAIFPHPVSDPAGHSHGIEPEPVTAPDPERWPACRSYLIGVDLFNHGYYWEAHEVWERLWHACGRSGVAGAFFKGSSNLLPPASRPAKAEERSPLARTPRRGVVSGRGS